MKDSNLNGDGAKLSLHKLAEYEPGNALQAAGFYASIGLAPIPLEGKTPLLPGWQKGKSFDEDELPRLFPFGRNVGIVLGGETGLVDVDLDNPLTVAAADVLLPDTLESGREKNPRSHRWYACEPSPSSRSYSLPKPMADRLGLDAGEAMLVELRSAGRQTVVAPSVHPEDGDRYLWHEGEIAKIDGEELERLVVDVAVATLLAFHWPPERSGRQFFALHTAGYLGRHMEHDRVEAVLLAAARIAGDEEIATKRVRAVRDTLAKLKKKSK